MIRTGNRSVSTSRTATAPVLALFLVLAIGACSPSAPILPPPSVVATIPPLLASPIDAPSESPGASGAIASPAGSVAPTTPSASTDPRLGAAIVTTPYGGAFARPFVTRTCARFGPSGALARSRDRIIFTATTRFSAVCRARYTTPMAPRPNSSRIS